LITLSFYLKTESKIPAKIEGKDIKICFNYKFLLEGIAKIKSKDIVIGLSNQEGPGIIKPVEDEGYFYIIMPIRI